jgi:hypothetical protein
VDSLAYFEPCIEKSGDFLVYFIPHFWRLKPANSLFILDFLFFFGEISPIKKKG